MNEVRFDDELQFAKVVLKWTLLKLTKILIFCATQQKYNKIIAKRKRYILIQYTTFTKYNLYLKYRKNKKWTDNFICKYECNFFIPKYFFSYISRHDN